MNYLNLIIKIIVKVEPLLKHLFHCIKKINLKLQNFLIIFFLLLIYLCYKNIALTRANFSLNNELIVKDNNHFISLEIQNEIIDFTSSFYQDAMEDQNLQNHLSQFVDYYFSFIKLNFHYLENYLLYYYNALFNKEKLLYQSEVSLSDALVFKKNINTPFIVNRENKINKNLASCGEVVQKMLAHDNCFLFKKAQLKSCPILLSLLNSFDKAKSTIELPATAFYACFVFSPVYKTPVGTIIFHFLSKNTELTIKEEQFLNTIIKNRISKEAQYHISRIYGKYSFLSTPLIL